MRPRLGVVVVVDDRAEARFEIPEDYKARLRYMLEVCT